MKTENSSETIELDGLVWESRSTWDYSRFNYCLSKLRSRGFARFPRPQEVFRLFIRKAEPFKHQVLYDARDLAEYEKARKARDQQYENQLSNNNLVSSMAGSDFGEWLSLAFRKKGTTLECVLDPENLRWRDCWEGCGWSRDENGKQTSRNIPAGHPSKYVVKKGEELKHSGKIMKFDIGNKHLGESYLLEEFPDDLVEFLYGRKFEDLPKEVRIGFYGGDQTRIQLPEEENSWAPVARSDSWPNGHNSRSLHTGCVHCRARGVRPIRI